MIEDPLLKFLSTIRFSVRSLPEPIDLWFGVFKIFVFAFEKLDDLFLLAK